MSSTTPERADGLDILHWFGGRIAAELRLWTALDQGLLAPFHYFAVADATNLSALEWRRGGYVPAELNTLYTGDHRRVALILSELEKAVAEPLRMRALGFCVGVEHARFMAECFRDALRRLQAGELQILFAVDLFNEGLDIPSIDTVLLLRPTESAVVFLQQLGRGLRLSPETGKSCLTVLDFIGQQHRRFRFDLRYRALLGISRRQLQEQLCQGFPFLPPGCRLVLDRVASERVLANLRQCLPSRRPQLLAELCALAAEGVIGPASGLADWLEALVMEPADFYGISGASFTGLRRELGWLPPADAGPPHPDEQRLSRSIAAGLLHLDDPDRLRSTASALAAVSPPDPAALSERERRQWLMLTAQLFGTGRLWRPLPEALTVLWQATAWRNELRQLLELLAERLITSCTGCPGPSRCHSACMATTAAPKSKPRLACSTTRPHGSAAKACSGTSPATPICCSSPCARAKPSSPPAPATATWHSAPGCSTGKVRAPPPPGFAHRSA
jgi:hypothetical protein